MRNAGIVAAAAMGFSIYAHPMSVIPMLAIGLVFGAGGFFAGHRMGRVRGRHEEFVALWSKFEMIPLRTPRSRSDIYVRPMDEKYAEAHGPQEDEFAR